MFRVLNCLTSDHDWRLVALAVLVCFGASAAALSLLQSARDARGATRAAWIAAAGAVGGGGIWATHFIAIIAYDPPVNVGYDVGLSALSLLVAMTVTAAGLGVAVRAPRSWGAAAGGAIVGAGIAAMHFVGMAALELPGRIAWSPDLVIAAIVLGIALTASALVVAGRKDAVATYSPPRCCSHWRSSPFISPQWAPSSSFPIRRASSIRSRCRKRCSP